MKADHLNFAYIKFDCRICKVKTDQIERIVTDNLPPNIKVLECTECGVLGVCDVGFTHD